jgi:iron-sulfur cluster assembly accessory protein
MISFTQAAIERLNGAIEPSESVRVAVMGGGCSGMSYSLTIETETDEDDILITLGSVNVYVDPHSAGILEETEIDYIKGLQMEGFVFNNSKANTTCGCGMSFS